MKVFINKVSGPNLKTKSYQMRIEFSEPFSDTDFERQLIEHLDLEWKKIGVYYFWHVGFDFADGFFDDFNNMKVPLEKIIETTKESLNKYKDKILSITFKDIN